MSDDDKSPACCWKDCHKPATRLLQFGDDDETTHWPYCDGHADEATERAFSCGVTLARSEVIAVVEAGPKRARFGRGAKVHLLYGRRALCGAGQSSHAHNYRSPRPRYTDDPVTCEHCLQIGAGGPDPDPTDPIPYDDPTDPDLPPVPGGSPAPTPCEAAGCSRPAAVALTDENATGPHTRYLCTPHAAVRRALAARPGARFHITNDVRLTPETPADRLDALIGAVIGRFVGVA